MGGESKQTTSQQSTTQPWDVAQPALKGILGQLNPLIQNAGLSSTSSNAINQLQQNAQAGNPYAGQIGGYTQNLLNGGGANAQAGNVQGGLDAYKAQMTPYANGSMVGNNPYLKSQMDTIMSDVGNSVNGQFAAAGRDMSGANQMAYGRGVAQGIAPVMANQYNQDVSNQMNAAGALYGAQNSTSGMLTGLGQQGLANQQQGMTNSNDAIAAQNYSPAQMLQLEQMRTQVPAQNLGLLASIGIPIAGLGSQNQGTSESTNQMSGAQQFGMIAGGLGSLFGGGRR